MKSLNKENFEKTINSNKLSIVKFWSEYCLQCSALDPTMKKLEDIYSNIKFYSANVAEIGEIATIWKIMALPTTILFRDGQPIHQFYGNLPQSEFEKEFDKL